MITVEELEEMSRIDVTSVNPNDLKDIRDIQIDTNAERNKKVQKFVEDIKNPYLFRYEDYVVKLEFADTEYTLQDLLNELITKVAEEVVI